MTLSGVPQLFASKYRVHRVLGEGGMGQVLLATHMQLDQKVAIKVLKRELTTDAVAVERFLREARAAARIDSDHVVRVSDVASLENGQPYIVMEYLEGEDLAQRLARGAMPMHEAVDCVLQACLGIAEAHRVGIVHRDLKPANLFVTRRRDGSTTLKVVDFGISKLAPTTGRPEASLTQDTLVGSPFYMSPEQIAGATDIDRRTDIWSLGLILFELLTAEGPFVAATMAQLCAKIQKAVARRLGEVRPDLSFPDALEEIVARCLAKDPAKRYEDTVDLAMDLVPFAKEDSRIARRISDSMPTKPPSPDAIVPLEAMEVEFPVEPPTGPAARAPSGDARVTSNAWNTGAGVVKTRRNTVLWAFLGGAAVVTVAALGVVQLVGSGPRAASSDPETRLTTSPTSSTKVEDPMLPPSPAPVATTVDPPTPTAPSETAKTTKPLPPPPLSVARPVPKPPTTAPKPPPSKPPTGNPTDEFGGRK